jgi:23S rRNA pseudouridine1911/1915/1917 synthase
MRRLALDATLAKLFPEHSRSRLQGWLKQGLILLDGAAAESKRKVYGGERSMPPPLPVREAEFQVRRARRRRLSRARPRTSR